MGPCEKGDNFDKVRNFRVGVSTPPGEGLTPDCVVREDRVRGMVGRNRKGMVGRNRKAGFCS